LVAPLFGRATLQIEARGYANRVLGFESGLGEVGVDAYMWQSVSYMDGPIAEARNACIASSIARLLPPTVDQTTLR